MDLIICIIFKENYSKVNQKHIENGDKMRKTAALSCLAGTEHNFKPCLDGVK